jgi:hypothetical protein
MRRRSLKGQLSIRLQQCSDSPALTDTELLLSAVSSLISSTEQLHGKLREETCLWKVIPCGDMFSSALVTEHYIGCNQERSAGMINGRPFSYCPFCGSEIEIEIESQTETEGDAK